MSTSLYGAGAEYALHSLLLLATRPEPVSVGDLATFQRIPERFLAKLFTRLKKAGIVTGQEGIAGGFALARPADRIPVMEVLQAVDPGRSLFACAEIRANCALFGPRPPEWATAGPCRIHALMREAEKVFQDHLGSRTLADLVCEVEHKAPKEFQRETGTWFQGRKDARTGRRKPER
ncbi:RrF2 family transcriptional regulator [Mesoterricola silvestris]|uniref:Transcriptional regulator n=1 Tax=Mesoterricola silvestris TaxID=2927979 RepID=A0AA48KAM4_9BACT|nr:Rrf2 family transcriptional regulator [Mesoterricola silvestris]BDU73462.1 transcriptional regulator [Mesoterricola silvestris]